jgi:hypothetical protein
MYTNDRGLVVRLVDAHLLLCPLDQIDRIDLSCYQLRRIAWRRRQNANL